MLRVFSVLLMLGITSAQAQTVPTCPVQLGSCGVSVGTSGSTPVTLQMTTHIRVYQRIVNSGASGSGTAWCSRAGTPAVNGVGSFALAPFGNSLGEPSVEEFGSGQAGANSASLGSTYVPQTATTCVSDGGASTTAAAILTVEVQ